MTVNPLAVVANVACCDSRVMPFLMGLSVQVKTCLGRTKAGHVSVDCAKGGGRMRAKSVTPSLMSTWHWRRLFGTLALTQLLTPLSQR